MRQFEYIYVHLPSTGPEAAFMDILKQRGEEGWELCGFEYGYAFFKREIIQQPRGGAM